MVSVSLAKMVCLERVLASDLQLRENCAAARAVPGNRNHSATSEPGAGLMQFSDYVLLAGFMLTQPDKMWLGVM